MTMLASQITSLTVVYSILYSGVNQRKHQSSTSLAFVREIHRGPVNFPHKWPVTRKMFPFDDVIMMHLRYGGKDHCAMSPAHHELKRSEEYAANVCVVLRGLLNVYNQYVFTVMESRQSSTSGNVAFSYYRLYSLLIVLMSTTTIMIFNVYDISYKCFGIWSTNIAHSQ